MARTCMYEPPSAHYMTVKHLLFAVEALRDIKTGGYCIVEKDSKEYGGQETEDRSRNGTCRGKRRLDPDTGSFVASLFETSALYCTVTGVICRTHMHTIYHHYLFISTLISGYSTALVLGDGRRSVDGCLQATRTLVG